MNTVKLKVRKGADYRNQIHTANLSPIALSSSSHKGGERILGFIPLPIFSPSLSVSHSTLGSRFTSFLNLIPGLNDGLTPSSPPL